MLPMTRKRARITLLAVAAWASTQAVAQTAPSSLRGQLLYATHCVECHNSQMHWRDNRLATDWDSLKDQVRQWQTRAMLNWSDAEIVEVARYLNDTVYRYPQTADRVSLVATPAAGHSR